MYLCTIECDIHIFQLYIQHIQQNVYASGRYLKNSTNSFSRNLTNYNFCSIHKLPLFLPIVPVWFWYMLSVCCTRQAVFSLLACDIFIYSNSVALLIFTSCLHLLCKHKSSDFVKFFRVAVQMHQSYEKQLWLMQKLISPSHLHQSNAR